VNRPGALLNEEAGELATGGFKGSQFFFRIAVVEHGAALTEQVKDESLDRRLSQSRGYT
jgi:hypothetical protein